MPPPPAPAPTPAPAPPPPQAAAPRPDAQIAIEKAAREKAEREKAEREAARAKAERERVQKQQLEAQRQREQEERAKKEQQARAQREAEQAREREKERERQAQQAAKEKAEREAADARLAQQRKENLERMLAQAQTSSGSPGATGTAAQSAAPSANYAGRLVAHIKPNIVLTDTLPATLAADVEVRAAPDGRILSRRVVKSSGNAAWDEAVLRAIDRTATLPRDVDGRVPGTLVITFRP